MRGSVLLTEFTFIEKVPAVKGPEEWFASVFSSF